MVGGSLTYSFRAGAPGDISYQLANSIGGITQDAFAPYKTDFMLQYQPPGGGAFQNIMGGIHVPVNLKNDEDAINVAGKDWSHWLEQPYWFEWYTANWDDNDALHTILTHSHSYSPGIHVYAPAAVYYPPATYREAITHLINNTQPAGRSTLTGGTYVPITPVFQAQIGTREIPPQCTLVVMFQDQTTILQHINNFGEFGDPYGFDWTMNPNKQMEFFGPRKEVKYAPKPIWTISKDQIVGGLAENPMLDLDWTNNGPLATHLIGTSNGSPGLWWHKRDQDSVNKFREWLRVETLGDQYIRGISLQHALDGLDYLHPQKDLNITVLPSLLQNAKTGEWDGFKNHIGDVIRVKWDFPPYHEVNAFFWINEQTYESDGEEWTCRLGLQQIYD